MEKIRGFLDEQVEMKRRISELDVDIFRQVMAIVNRGNEDDTHEVIQFLYWEQEFNPKEIARAVGAANYYVFWSEFISPLPLWSCLVCRRTTFATSRAKRAELISKCHCVHCEKDRLDRQRESNRKIIDLLKSSEKEELSKLKYMPYAEYLKTDHWKIVRRNALYRSRFKCQLCNASARLNVHHRDYSRRGAELSSDVIALCENCHSLFHGKIAQKD